MYALVEVGNEQFKISEGDLINTARIDKEKSKTLSLDKVLLFADGAKIEIGQPHLKGIKVTAKVVDHFPGDKVIAFKYRRRKASSTKRGHRQKLTALQITKIAAG